MRRTIEASAHDSRAIDLPEAAEPASPLDEQPAGRGPAPNGVTGTRAWNPRGERRRAWARRFVLPLAVAAVTLGAALWPRAPFALDVGAPGDRLFLGGVHGDERTAEHSYRWTGKGEGDATLTAPGWGAVRRVRAEVRAQALPERAPVTVELWANGVAVGALEVDGAMAARDAEFDVPAGGAVLRLALRSPLTEAPGDSRSLGVKLDAGRLTPLARDAGAYLRT